jgi:hypothetical protein
MLGDVLSDCTQMSPDQIQQWQLHQQCMAMHHHRMMMMMQMGMGHAQGPMRPPMGMDMNKMMMSQQEQEEEVNELSRAQLLPEHGSPESQEQAAREQQEEGGAEEGVRNDQVRAEPSIIQGTFFESSFGSQLKLSSLPTAGSACDSTASSPHQDQLQLPELLRKLVIASESARQQEY